MKALSQSDYGLIRSLYQDVYAPDIAESILDEFTDEDLDDLTDEYIEEQVIEFFEECLEEGLDIDIVEQTICESVDTELEILTEVTNPAQVAAMRMRDKTSAASGEGQKSGRDAGASARAKLKVSKEKVGSASPEKKASALSRIKGAVKKVGKAAQGGVGLATRAVGTAVRAGSAVKSAAKKGYERGRQGSGGGSSSSSSDSGSSSSSSSSDTGPSSSSSSGGGESSPAPRKRKDGLLKRGLKKVVRGITKGVSAAAGAVKAGADSLTDRARKEDMNYNKELATIKELYSQVCNHQSEEEIEEDMKPLPKEKMERQSNKAYAKEVVAARQGNEKETNKQMQRRIAMKDPAGRKAALRKEELEATGLFTAKEIEALVESENVDEAMSSYDRNRKRAAQRAADRNAARAAGKTGVVPGVGYVTPNKERETYTDEKGTVRHKSGAKNEEFEQLDELSKGTMGSYVKKASKDVEKRSYSQGSTDAEDAEIGYPGQTPKDKKIDKRQKGIGRAVKRLTRNEELESLRQAYLSMSNGGEQLDEISQKTATNAYTARRRAGVEGNDTEENSDKGDKTREHIKRKFGDKAAKNADRAATAGTFGRGTPSAKERIEKNRDYRTTKAGKMYGQDQKSLKSDLKKRLTRKEELESLRQAYLSIISEGEQPNIEHLNRYGGHPEVKPKKKKKTPFEKENPGHSEDKPTARFTKADREEMLASKKEASDKVAASAKKYGKK